MNYKRIQIVTKGTNNEGQLSFFESKELGFEIRRIYYIYGVPQGVQRGGHAHKKLRQLLFCPYGSIKLILDDGYEKKEVILNNPSEGLLLEMGIWRDIYWLQDNSVLCVAASEYYDESDYIRDYDDFKKWVKRDA